jgi:hypothetical protein
MVWVVLRQRWVVEQWVWRERGTARHDSSSGGEMFGAESGWRVHAEARAVNDCCMLAKGL